jgi:Arc/MetJ-type ribon-helix-helix transcriptional regulator
MKQVIVELDAETAARLEQVAAARSRKRSAFIRNAIRRALDAELERQTEEAYRLQPDDLEPPYLDPRAWEPRRARRPKP